jgi:hypothetical protein
MGRGEFAVGEAATIGLEDLGLRVALAIAAGELEGARALLDEAIRPRAQPDPAGALAEASRRRR